LCVWCVYINADDAELRQSLATCNGLLIPGLLFKFSSDSHGLLWPTPRYKSCIGTLCLRC
jgi:hypothetical protein